MIRWWRWGWWDAYPMTKMMIVVNVMMMITTLVLADRVTI
jgi:hypothetical protein